MTQTQKIFTSLMAGLRVPLDNQVAVFSGLSLDTVSTLNVGKTSARAKATHLTTTVSNLSKDIITTIPNQYSERISQSGGQGLEQ